MATSPSHKLGQLIGNLLEGMFIPLLQDVANRNNLYLDVVGQSRPSRKGKKINWIDRYGSTHDLDFVIEFGGEDHVVGRPVAFIESAWRRYTKHSKNKVQEIQGAILPIADKYSIECPFLGAILAGEFTAPSLIQLRNSGFTVLYLSYENLVSAFKDVGIDISFVENTSTQDLSEKVHAIESLSQEQLIHVRDILFTQYQKEINVFIKTLEEKIKKQIKYIIICPIYGNQERFEHLSDAKKFILNFNTEDLPQVLEFRNFIISVEYINNDSIKAEYSSKDDAIRFLDFILSTP